MTCVGDAGTYCTAIRRKNEAQDRPRPALTVDCQRFEDHEIEFTDHSQSVKRRKRMRARVRLGIHQLHCESCLALSHEVLFRKSQLAGRSRAILEQVVDVISDAKISEE
jgi:hypothetical protein